MKKLGILLSILLVRCSVPRTIVEVEHIYNKSDTLLIYKPNFPPHNHLKDLKITERNKSVILFFGFPEGQNFKLVNGELIVKEKFFYSPQTSMSESVVINNQRNVEILIEKTKPNKIVLESSYLKKYKYIFIDKLDNKITITYSNQLRFIG